MSYPSYCLKCSHNTTKTMKITKKDVGLMVYEFIFGSGTCLLLIYSDLTPKFTGNTILYSIGNRGVPITWFVVLGIFVLGIIGLIIQRRVYLNETKRT